MLVVERNERQYYWNIGNEVKPLNYKGEIVIAFDPSKSNMAIVVGTPVGLVLNNLEFSGNNRKRGPAMDTTLFCQEVRTYLKQHLEGCTIYMAVTEATIEKKGANYYQSNLVLTEIRANILNFFREQFSIECIEVNNWTWKHAILPDGYRGQRVKGSKPFMEHAFPELRYHLYFEADMCDVVCIFWYTITTLCKSYTLLCNKTELCDLLYAYLICPNSSAGFENYIEVVFNDRFNLEDNLSFYTNRLTVPFRMEVPVAKIPISAIYDHAKEFELSNIKDTMVKVVAVRCSG